MTTLHVTEKPKLAKIILKELLQLNQLLAHSLSLVSVCVSAASVFLSVVSVCLSAMSVSLSSVSVCLSVVSVCLSVCPPSRMFDFSFVCHHSAAAWASSLAHSLGVERSRQFLLQPPTQTPGLSDCIFLCLS